MPQVTKNQVTKNLKMPNIKIMTVFTYVEFRNCTVRKSDF
jgi:hypothetical protein